MPGRLDVRSTTATAGAPRMSGSVVLLIRHADTAFHAVNRYAGSTDLPLTDHGHEQAAALGAWAATAGLKGLWCSPLRRARETAQPVAEATGLSLHVDPRLAEVDFGAGEGLTPDEMRQGFPLARAAFEENPYCSPFPDGESPRSALERGVQAVEELATTATDAPLMVICHSTLLRLVVCGLLELDPSGYRRLMPRIYSTSGAVLRRGSRSWGLIALNPALVADLDSAMEPARSTGTVCPPKARHRWQ